MRSSEKIRRVISHFLGGREGRVGCTGRTKTCVDEPSMRACSEGKITPGDVNIGPVRWPAKMWCTIWTCVRVRVLTILEIVVPHSREPVSIQTKYMARCSALVCVN